MTTTTHDHQGHDHTDDDEGDFEPHIHPPLYRATSLIGALMCLRCSAFVSGLITDLEVHNKFHDETAAPAANGETVVVEEKKTKKGKKHGD
jgi:hypothetical protein